MAITSTSIVQLIKNKIEEKPFYLSLFIYIFLGVLILPFYQYQLNVDGISYISIAQKYLIGDFNNAFNGYWGPLFSWLLIPFLWFNISPVLAAKILLLISGIGTILGTCLLLKKFEIDNRIKLSIYFILPIIVLYFAFWTISPDLFVCTFLLFYFYLISSDNYTKSKRNAIFIGLIAALTYFSKAYGLPFFLTHFSIFNIYLFFKERGSKRRNIVMLFLIGLVSFFIISSPWIYIISKKYDKLIYSTSPSHNQDKNNPDAKGETGAFFREGLIEPPNSTAINAWEDPSYLKSIPHSRYTQTDLLIYRIKNFAKNLLKLGIFIFFFSPLLFPLTIINFKHILKNPFSYSLLLVIVIYAAGYLLILIENRYIWFIYIIVVVFTTYLLDEWLKQKFFSKHTQKLITLLFFLSFLPVPTYGLVNCFNRDKEMFDLSQKLSKYEINGSVASNNNWTNTYYLSFYSGTRFYGETQFISENDAEAKIKKYNIEYFFFWNDEIKSRPKYLVNCKSIFHDASRKLSIYKLENK